MGNDEISIKKKEKIQSNKKLIEIEREYRDNKLNKIKTLKKFESLIKETVNKLVKTTSLNKLAQYFNQSFDLDVLNFIYFVFKNTFNKKNNYNEVYKILFAALQNNNHGITKNRICLKIIFTLMLEDVFFNALYYTKIFEILTSPTLTHLFVDDFDLMIELVVNICNESNSAVSGFIINNLINRKDLAIKVLQTKVYSKNLVSELIDKANLKYNQIEYNCDMLDVKSQVCSIYNSSVFEHNLGVLDGLLNDFVPPEFVAKGLRNLLKYIRNNHSNVFEIEQCKTISEKVKQVSMKHPTQKTVCLALNCLCLIAKAHCDFQITDDVLFDKKCSSIANNNNTCGPFVVGVSQLFLLKAIKTRNINHCHGNDLLLLLLKSLPYNISNDKRTVLRVVLSQINALVEAIEVSPNNHSINDVLISNFLDFSHLFQTKKNRRPILNVVKCIYQIETFNSCLVQFYNKQEIQTNHSEMMLLMLYVKNNASLNKIEIVNQLLHMKKHDYLLFLISNSKDYLLNKEILDKLTAWQASNNSSIDLSLDLKIHILKVVAGYNMSHNEKAYELLIECLECVNRLKCLSQTTRDLLVLRLEHEILFAEIEKDIETILYNKNSSLFVEMKTKLTLTKISKLTQLLQTYKNSIEIANNRKITAELNNHLSFLFLFRFIISNCSSRGDLCRSNYNKSIRLLKLVNNSKLVNLLHQCFSNPNSFDVLFGHLTNNKNKLNIFEYFKDNSKYIVSHSFKLFKAGANKVTLNAEYHIKTKSPLKMAVKTLSSYSTKINNDLRLEFVKTTTVVFPVHSVNNNIFVFNCCSDLQPHEYLYVQPIVFDGNAQFYGQIEQFSPSGLTS